jgi:hypothetical protein
MFAKAKGLAGTAKSFEASRKDVAQEVGNLACSTGSGLLIIGNFVHLFSDKQRICWAS